MVITSGQVRLILSKIIAAILNLYVFLHTHARARAHTHTHTHTHKTDRQADRQTGRVCEPDRQTDRV